MNLDRILVAVDGSATSARAAAWAADLALDHDAEVVAVHAMGLLEPGPDGTFVIAEPHREGIRERFETEWCAPLDRPGLHVRTLLRDGPAARVLLDVAAREEVDLIVVGSRGLGGDPRLLLGSTSTQVAQLADRPVTIVPAG